MFPLFITVHDREGKAKVVNASHIVSIADDGDTRTLCMSDRSAIHGVAETPAAIEAAAMEKLCESVD